VNVDRLDVARLDAMQMSDRVDQGGDAGGGAHSLQLANVAEQSAQEGITALACACSS